MGTPSRVAPGRLPVGVGPDEIARGPGCPSRPRPRPRRAVAETTFSLDPHHREARMFEGDPLRRLAARPERAVGVQANDVALIGVESVRGVATPLDGTPDCRFPAIGSPRRPRRRPPRGRRSGGRRPAGCPGPTRRPSSDVPMKFALDPDGVGGVAAAPARHVDPITEVRGDDVPVARPWARRPRCPARPGRRRPGSRAGRPRVRPDDVAQDVVADGPRPDPDAVAGIGRDQVAARGRPRVGPPTCC